MHLREHTPTQEDLIDIDPAELAELPFELAMLDLEDDADEGDALTALYGELTERKVPSLSVRLSELAAAKKQRGRARRKKG